MADSKERRRRRKLLILSQFQERLSPLKREIEEIDKTRIAKFSRELRAIELGRPEQKNIDPKELGFRMELIDSVVNPILLAASYVVYEDKNLLRLLSQGSQESQREKLLEIVGRCLEEILQGRELNLARVKIAAEETAFQTEPSDFVKKQIERLRQNGP